MNTVDIIAVKELKFNFNKTLNSIFFLWLLFAAVYRIKQALIGSIWWELKNPTIIESTILIKLIKFYS